MASKVRESGGRDSGGRISLIDLNEKGEAPFAVRRADEYPAGAENGHHRLDIWSWFGKHPVAVGVATGVICFAVISTAISLTMSSNEQSESDGPLADAAASQPADNRGSFSAEVSAGVNFSSDQSKRSRAGASGKDFDEETGTVGTGGHHVARPAIAFTTNDTSTAISSAPWESGRSSSSTTDENSGLTGTTQSIPGSTQATGGTNTTAATAGQTTNTTSGLGSTSGTDTTTTQPASSTTDTTGPSGGEFSIAAPGDESLHPWESPTSFAANLLSGASQYCWTFTQSGIGSTESCSAGTTYQLPAYPDFLIPGLVTVTANASGSFGTVSETIQISLYRSTVFTQPQAGAVFTVGADSLQIDVTNLFGTTSRCFRLTQTGYDSGELCYDDSNVLFGRQHAIWDDLAPGPLTVQATIWGGGMVLSSDSVEVELQ